MVKQILEKSAWQYRVHGPSSKVAPGQRNSLSCANEAKGFGLKADPRLVGARDGYGNTALMLVCKLRGGDLLKTKKIIKLLLKHGVRLLPHIYQAPTSTPFSTGAGRARGGDDAERPHEPVVLLDRTSHASRV